MINLNSNSLNKIIKYLILQDKQCLKKLAAVSKKLRELTIYQVVLYYKNTAKGLERLSYKNNNFWITPDIYNLLPEPNIELAVKTVSAMEIDLYIFDQEVEGYMKISEYNKPELRPLYLEELIKNDLGLGETIAKSNRHDKFIEFEKILHPDDFTRTFKQFSKKKLKKFIQFSKYTPEGFLNPGNTSSLSTTRKNYMLNATVNCNDYDIFLYIEQLLGNLLQEHMKEQFTVLFAYKNNPYPDVGNTPFPLVISFFFCGICPKIFKHIITKYKLISNNMEWIHMYNLVMDLPALVNVLLFLNTDVDFLKSLGYTGNSYVDPGNLQVLNLTYTDRKYKQSTNSIINLALSMRHIGIVEHPIVIYNVSII